MSAKYTTAKPFVVMMYGFPGSGKTNFAHQLTGELGLIHIQEDKIAHDFFGDKAEKAAGTPGLRKITNYMTKEFLRHGGSVVYDVDVLTARERRAVRDIAFETKATPILVWFQVDPETTYMRTQSRDRRKTDDKYAKVYNEDSYRDVLSRMQNPNQEEYIVVSGKHTYQTQRGTVLKRLYDLGVVSPETASSGVVKPGLVNLVPQTLGGRAADIRRNISIR